jgi:flagellar assembly factor FliW
MTVDSGLATASEQAEAAPIPETVAVETRFGVYEFEAQSRIFMPAGPLGFQECRNFGLANLPDPRLSHFKLLQSLDQPDLSFIVTALPEDGGPIANEDLEEICRSVDAPLDEAIFLLIVTIRPNPQGEGITMTVNLRAPIVFTPHSGQARQCVSSKPDYAVQQPFYGWPAA